MSFKIKCTNFVTQECIQSKLNGIVVTSQFPLTGDGSNGNPLTISNANNPDEVLQWDGSMWQFAIIPRSIGGVESYGLAGVNINTDPGGNPLFIASVLVPANVLGMNNGDHMDIEAYYRINNAININSFVALGWRQPPVTGAVTSITRIPTNGNNNYDGVVRATLNWETGSSVFRSNAYDSLKTNVGGPQRHSPDTQGIDPTMDWEITLNTSGAGNVTGLVFLLKYLQIYGP